MKILFDGFWWANGPFSNRQVMRELIFAWERTFADDELIVATPRADEALARSELPARVRVVGTRLRPQGVSAILELPVIARRLRVDHIVTHNFTPLFGRSSAFVHDVLFVTNPEWFTRKELAYFSLMTSTMGRAHHVFTSSATEAARIDHIGRARRSVVPVGLAVPPGVADAVPERVDGLAGVDGFVLIVGRLNVRKNLAVALEAAVQSTHVGPRFPVVVVGEPSGRAAVLPAAVRQAVDAGIVRFAGFVSDDQLAWLYVNTRLCVFLSLDEGFGLPSLEALSFGAPLLISDIAVFHEILGELGSYVDPRDPAAITEAMDRLLSQTERPEAVDPATLGYSWGASVRRMRSAIAEG